MIAAARRDALTALLGALAACLPVASAEAQASLMRVPSAWAGGGITRTQPGSLATESGAMALAVLELPLRRPVGPVAIALRAEGRWSRQRLAAAPLSSRSGDVETVSGGLTARIAPRSARAAGHIVPYLLVGVGASRPSTRILIAVRNTDVPAPRFEQTTSQVAATGAGGAGALIHAGALILFAEARVEFVRRRDGMVRSSFATAGVALPLHR